MNLDLRTDQLDTLGIAIAWLLDYHDARISDGSSNRPSDKLDKLALMISRDRLSEIALSVSSARKAGRTGPDL